MIKEKFYHRRGVNVIFGQERKKGKLIYIPCDKIRAGDEQPRQEFTPEALASLADSIRENGVLQPILVRKKEGLYYIVAGERRFRAAKMAGLEEMPCLLVQMSDTEAAVAALLENLQRKDLNCFEEAQAILRLIEEYDLTQEQAAQKLGKKQSTIANKIRLLRLTPDEQQVILSHGLTERHARALIGVTDDALRGKLLQQACERNMNVAQLEKHIAQAEKTAGPAVRRTFIAKDVRLFLNTIDHAIKVMQNAGIRATREQIETDEGIEIRIRIPRGDTYRDKTA